MTDIRRLINDAIEIGCDPIVHGSSDTFRMLEEHGVELTTRQGDFYLMPMWMANATLTFLDEGYADMTLGEYLSRITGEEA